MAAPEKIRTSVTEKELHDALKHIQTQGLAKELMHKKEFLESISIGYMDINLTNDEYTRTSRK